MKLYRDLTNLPDKLYHYYSFNKYAKQTLREGYIYLNKPKNFNDREELRIELRRTDNLLSLDEIFDDFSVKFTVDGEEIEKPFESQYEMAKEVLNDNANTSRNYEGIYCLTDSPFNKDMWDSEDYTSKGKGFCVEFDTKEFLDSIDRSRSIFGKVEYVENRQHDIYLEPYWPYFHKTKEWQKEHEYRYAYLAALEDREREFHFDRRALKRIYLGSALDDEDIKELQNIVNTVYEGNVELCAVNLP